MRVHLVTTGAAARAIADQLSTELRAAGDLVIVTELSAATPLDASFWPTADLRIVAAWRDSAALFEAADRLAHESGTPYTQIVFEHPRLRVGPTIVPGGHGGPAATSGGCHVCFTKRQRQHNPGIDRAAALWRHYEANPDAGPEGYLTTHVALATALVDRVIAAAERNRVHLLHLLQGGISSSELIPLHACPRCGTARPDASWHELELELAHLAVAPSGVAAEGVHHHG
jgi:bacteriocin biosynthesis cyclodehydratase domain-containing protein